MADFYNTLGSSTFAGTTGRDLFYPFTKDPNFDHLEADAVVSLLVWNTGILLANGSAYQITAPNVQISTDMLSGAEGTDIVYCSNAADALFYNNGVISGGFGSFSNIEQFWLGNGNDIIDLSAHGAGGIDYAKSVAIHGQDGNDIIIGGAGKDTLEGDAGNDIIFGYRGADTIYGGTGDDLLYGDDLGFNGIAGDDILEGGAGNDVLYGGARSDNLNGGDDNDILYGQEGGDGLSGGSGDDVLYGDDANTVSNDILNGDAGNDQLYGGAGDDELYGGSGDDLLEGGGGNDYMTGGGGNDALIVGTGNDLIDGSADVDTAVFAGNRADYLFTLQPDGSYVVTDARPGSPDGIKTVRNVEFFAFADGTVAAGGLNHPPVITSNGGGATAAIAIDENGLAVTTVSATDPDAGQTVSYLITGGVDAALFTVDPATGALAFINAPDFESPADSDGNNVYQVIVAASDGNGGVATQALSITVRDVVDGAAPVITSNGGGATAALTVAESATSVTTVAATDADGTTPSYAIVGGADAQLFSINPVTGALVFTSAPDYENPADQNHDNVYEVIVEASDGANTDRQTIAVTVGNLNDNAPVITSYGGAGTAALTVLENTTAAATVVATDADGTPLAYSIVGGADAALFTIDAATGALSFLSAPDYENPGDSDGNRVYQVTVRASDGTTNVSQALAITIANANDNAPVITSNGSGVSASINLAENIASVTVVTATDADGTTPSYTIAGGADAALFTINAVTGALSFTTAPDFENRIDADANGVYEVIVGASDGANLDTQSLSITITDVNEGGKVITGSSGNNTITPTTTVIAYQTTALNDTIYGLAGNDIIDGGQGADYMDGGSGNDTFYVDTWSDDGFAGNDDRVIEVAGGGTDLVISVVNYTLADQVENLTLGGSAAVNGTGNALANTITGNAAVNLLSGGLGIDKLYGVGGNDTLYGGDGNDILDGGVGADSMNGGTGDDTYYVETWSNDGNSANDDQVFELASEGTADLVNASVSFTLSAEVERLILTGSAAIDGVGNASDNILTGNAANNSLWGGLGKDTINGGAGDDRLFGEDGVDTLDGGAGNDRIDGGATGDTLKGSAGNDTLIGGTGKDTLTGGLDADAFVFAFGDTTLSSASIDKITDFRTSEGDRIDLDIVAGSLPSANYSEAAIATNNYADALALAKTTASAGRVTFIAGTTDGWLFWDGNGDGLLDQAVQLLGVNSLGGMDLANII